MSIAQRDLDRQKGTNAKVLAYLLRPENDFYIVTHENGERQTTPEFLRLVTTQRPEIRVLLDVGAQILDFSDSQVAKAWLDITRDTAGAIYFDKNDELMVLTKWRHFTNAVITAFSAVRPLCCLSGSCAHKGY